MKQEDKELLIKDLCARLPYGVICEDGYGNVLELNSIDKPNTVTFKCSDNTFCTADLDKCKPYLFPIESMTEEQQEELITITNGKFRYMWGDITNAIPRKNTSEWGISENAFINGIKVINILYIWLLKNYFDINGLIPMGLAHNATNLNIY